MNLNWLLVIASVLSATSLGIGQDNSVLVMSLFALAMISFIICILTKNFYKDNAEEGTETNILNTKEFKRAIGIIVLLYIIAGLGHASMDNNAVAMILLILIIGFGVWIARNLKDKLKPLKI